MSRPRGLWMEFISKDDLCGLCGQFGVIDTRGLKSPAGWPCGGLFFCICPNGRALKQQGADLASWAPSVQRERGAVQVALLERRRG